MAVEVPEIKDFYIVRRCINAIHSTWPEFGEPMSDGKSQILRLRGYVNGFFNVFEVYGNISTVFRFSGTYQLVLVKHFCNSTTYIFKNDIELHKESDNYCMNVACHGCTSHRQILQ